MHIKTTEGWKPLYVPTRGQEPELYKGILPSFECRNFAAQVERAHRQWGERLKQLRAAEDKAARRA